jgi:ligand-binding sensor domain-containing protein
VYFCRLIIILNFTYHLMKTIQASIFCFILLCFTAGFAQNAKSDLRVGEWKSYLGHRQNLQSAVKDKVIYTITNGGMFSYDTDNKELHTYSTVEGMSSISPQAIYYNAATQTMFVGHTDGAIDYFKDPSNIQNQSDIKINAFYTQKNIYTFVGDADRLYVGTDFGLVLYDLAKMEPKFAVTQIANNPVRTAIVSIAVFDNKIWVVLKNGYLYYAPTSAANLADPSIWTQAADLLPSIKARSVAANDTHLYALMNDGKTYHYTSQGWELYPAFSAGGQDKLRVTQQQVLAFSGIDVWVGKHDKTLIKHYFAPYGVPQDANIIDNQLFLSTNDRGLTAYPNMGDTYELLNPDGPYTNDCLNIIAHKGELYIAPGGYDNGMAPILNYNGIYYRNRTGWKNLQKNSGLPQSRINGSFVRTYWDKKNDNVYVGSWGMGIAKLKTGELQSFYDCANSGITGVEQICDTFNLENTRVAGMEMDENGNFWVATQYSRSPLQVFTNDGRWINMRNTFNGTRISGLTIDDYNNKWVITQKGGVFVYNDKGTIDNISDDVSVALTANEKQGNLPSSNIYAVVKDVEGDIWLGTDEGVRIMYSNYLNELSKGKYADVRAPIVDGYPLLRSENINTIAVDGGNRKWLGTNSGVYLVSADGLQILANFTTENSPLISNTVNYISIDGITGEVFFATSLGLISYRGTSTESSETCQEVSIFPNPAFTDYNGLISITGLGSESIVKITTVSGLLVREVYAEGGTAVWDGTDVKGKKVSTGVYLAFAANKDGKNPCVGKFTVIER